MATISVIVPVYRVESYLKECVESILNQTFTDFELILVDDGSPDNCPQICDAYACADQRVVVVHKENGGLSSARNEGLKIAKGKYIAFVDSDDYVDKRLFEICLNAMKENDVDLVKFKYKKFSSDEHVYVVNNDSISDIIFDIRNKEKKCSFITETLLSHKIGWETWSSFYKSSIIKKNNLFFEDNNRIFAEDIYFTTVYSLCCDRIVCLNDCLYFYRKRDGSIMNSLSNYKMNEMNELSKALLLKEREFGFDDMHFLVHNKLIIDRLYYLPKLNSYKNMRIWKRSLISISDFSFFKENVQHFVSYAFKNNLIQKNSYEYIVYNFLINKNIFVCLFRFLLNKIKRFMHGNN